MTDLNPCPSCGEPLDHPSGDGCANMTAHKERAMTDEEFKKLNELNAPEEVWVTHQALCNSEPEYQYLSNVSANAWGADYNAPITKWAANTRYVRADRIEALTEQLTAARQDAKEAEAYAEELEAKLVKAEAESEKYKHAFAAQSRKLQAVLHIEGVKATLEKLKGEKHD